MKTLLLAALFALSLPASAAQVCTNVYNPMSGKWDFVCTDGHFPQCSQVYDPMNRVWVTVCN
jgi:hypothetical protein